MQEKLNNWERIESVITWANMTTNYFARYIGLARGENLYQIKRGNNGISRKIATLITEKFPEVNILWLLTGDGEMLNGEEHRGASTPLYNVGVEENIRQFGSLEPGMQLVLPSAIDCDFGMLYLGSAMNGITPTNSVILLKKIAVDTLIPGDECVIITKKIVLLRIVKCLDDGCIQLIATNREQFGDIAVDKSEIEMVYKVKGKILINN